MQGAALAGLVALVFLTGCASRVEDQTVGKSAGTCEVHQVRMEKAKVPIEYGLPMPETNRRELYDARDAQFPNAAEPVSGGCCVSDDMAYHAWIWACPECTKAMKAWKAGNP